jgi:uncharacterized damage-inducible protein DinB
MKYTPNEADFLRRELAASIAGEDESLLKVVAALPPDKLSWRPTQEKSRPFGELAYHAAGAGHFFCCILDGKAPEDPQMSPQSVKQLEDGIRELASDFQRRLARYTPEQLADEYDFFGQKHPGITLLSWHQVHLIHHRAQLCLYLRIMGAKVPSIYGPSGDQELPNQ